MTTLRDVLRDGYAPSGYLLITLYVRVFWLKNERAAARIVRTVRGEILYCWLAWLCVASFALILALIWQVLDSSWTRILNPNPEP